MGLGKPADKVRPLGARSDEAHLAPQDAPEVRQFVEMRGPNHLANPGNAAIVLDRPARHAIGFRIRPHASEFRQLERFAATPDALLPVEDGATVFQPDGNRDTEEQRHQEDKNGAAQNNVDETFAPTVQARRVKAIFNEEPVRQQKIEIYSAGFMTVKDFVIAYFNAAEPAIYQCPCRQLGPIIGCDDNLFDAIKIEQVRGI